MTEYYFDIETLGFDAYTCKVITIQFQEMYKETGIPKSGLTILKEWESSEKEILEQLLDKLNPSYAWDFIPIGFNLRFDLTFLQIRIKEVLGVNIDSKWLHYDLPRIDLKDTIVMINNGSFKGSTLDWFVRKEFDNSEVPGWYDKGEYEKIEYYINDESMRFIDAYKFLATRLPKLFDLYDPLP